MLQAVPKSLFAWDFALMDGARTVADIEFAYWAESGRLRVDGVAYEIRREGWLNGAFLLSAGDAVVARAEKPSLFRRSFDVHHEDRLYALSAEDPFGRTLVLMQGTRRLGSVSPERLFSRRARVDLPEDLPLPLRAFMLWLALLLWKRAANAAVAAT